jgi:hypothetical protein
MHGLANVLNMGKYMRYAAIKMMKNINLSYSSLDFKISCNGEFALIDYSNEE